jgi:hypothetical protein
VRAALGLGPSPITIVTGADRTHHLSLLQLLESLERHERRARVVAYDLGLEPDDRARLERRFHRVEVRTFDYSRYPAYFDIRCNAGAYAWKPVIVAEVLEECRGRLVWLDAGCVVTEPLFALRRRLARHGFHSPASSGTIGQWTHPATLDWLGADPRMLGRRPRFAAVVAVDYDHVVARDVIRRWAECARVQECIAPPGADRSNHRHDQAVLTILVEQSSLDGLRPEFLGVEAHRDIREPGSGPS